jgi:dynactin 1
LSNVGTLETKIRHLEKQHGDDQELLKELTQAKDERDRFHGIIQKLQSKCQTLHQDVTESRAQMQQLQAEHDKLARGHEEHEADWEIALLDKEMAEERAEQAESELEALRSKLEERDMELEILRDEAEMFTTDMSEDEKQEAGYYRLQHENDRLRQALVALKEMTEERERDNKGRLAELESDVSVLEKTQEENAALQEQIQQNDSIIEHLRAQVDASADWEDVSNELTNKNQELEDKISIQDALIRDLESLKELNDELELQHMDEAEDLQAEIALKDIEIAEQAQRILEQESVMADHQVLISKFRELVFELQGKMTDAESSRNMTETQAKDTNSRFNEVMDLNRRLRASNQTAVTKDISLGLRQLEAEETTQKLAILTETGSPDFVKSLPVNTYFAAKGNAVKAALTATLLSTADREMSYNSGLDEALSRLGCVEAVQHLAIIKSDSDRMWSAMDVCDLANFTTFGPVYEELLAVEKALDQGLETLARDEVNFSEIAGSLERTSKIQQAVIAGRGDVLSARPEDETIARVQSIVARLDYLSANFTVVNTMLHYLEANATDLLADTASDVISPDDVTETAERVLELFAPSSGIVYKAASAAKKLLSTVEALRKDSLYPHILQGVEDVIEQEAFLKKLAHEAAEWGSNALKAVSSSFQPEAASTWLEVDLEKMLQFYWGSEVERLTHTAHLLDAWVEGSTLLQNSSEIVHGSTPWSQKAKEMEATRKKASEASVLLENLKAEHKATVLNFVERERIIEDKSLIIEHLEAKYRDASNKVLETEQLRDRVSMTEQEKEELLKQIYALQKEINVLRESVARSDKSDHAHNEPDASNAVKEPVEQPTTSTTVPAQMKSLLGALQTENHWLRQREHANVFEHNLRHIFGEMRQAKRWERIQSSDFDQLDAWLNDQDDMPPRSEKDSKISEKSSYTSRLSYGEVESAPRTTTFRPKISPFALGPSKMSWQSSIDSAAGSWGNLEMSLEEEADEDWDEYNAFDLESISESM